VKRRLFWASTITISVLAGLFVAVLVSSDVPLRSDTLRRQMVASLSARLNSDVSLGDLSLRVYPRLHAEGADLVIRQRGRTDAPPLISVGKFAVDADLIGLVRRHVAHVALTGLDINIVPRAPEEGTAPEGTGEPVATSGADADAGDHAAAGNRPRTDPDVLRDGVTVDTLETTDAHLSVYPRNRDKGPRVWTIHRLRMHAVGAGPMPFEAALTNAVPPGEIDTSGTFGPWERDDPGRTPLGGRFSFAQADLSVFGGISGMLSSTGTFGGSLARIDVHGETQTPDFTIAVGGHPFPLHTVYHSIVDGMNGDTRLERIDADFLRSSLVARGAVIDGPKGQPGRTVTLLIDMTKARVEDVMKMAVKAPNPPMTGALSLTTQFLLPPGPSDVAERLRLDGEFSMDRVHFTNYNVQQRIDQLSHLSRGRAGDDRRDSVVSNFRGRFLLANGRMVARELAFDVPGARVTLAGSYALKPETLDFRGTMVMQAKISETQRGIKRLLLKAIDPIFSKPGGGSEIPIMIGGRRTDPKFGLDVRRVFKRGNTP
jgi:hypothetical protein